MIHTKMIHTKMIHTKMIHTKKSLTNERLCLHAVRPMADNDCLPAILWFIILCK